MKTINEIIKKDNSTLAKLISKSQESHGLKIIFASAVDKDLIKYCDFATYKNSVLTVTVSNQAFATKVRYAIPDIIKNLKIYPEFKDLTKIRYVVEKTPIINNIKSKQKPAKLSQSIEILWRKTMSELKNK